MIRKFSEIVPTLSAGKTKLRALQCWAILISLAHNRSIITYGELADKMGTHHRPLNLILGHIMYYCQTNELPPLTSIVVNQDTGVPGEGFTAEETSRVPAQHIQVFRFDWFDLIPPTLEDFQGNPKEDEEED